MQDKRVVHMSVTMPAQSPILRVLVVIAGLGQQRRLGTVAASVRQVVDGAAAGTLAATCLLYVYVAEVELPSALLAQQVPLCRVVRQTGGMLMHLLSVPAADINSNDAVFVLPSSVLLTWDVSLPMLWRVMKANDLAYALPACDTCKTKRSINRDYKYAVGRHVNFADLQATLFTPAAYECLQGFANKTVWIDKFAWATWTLYAKFCGYEGRYTNCRKGCRPSRLGIVDAMHVHKVESANTCECAPSSESGQPAPSRTLPYMGAARSPSAKSGCLPRAEHRSISSSLVAPVRASLCAADDWVEAKQDAVNVTRWLARLRPDLRLMDAHGKLILDDFDATFEPLRPPEDEQEAPTEPPLHHGPHGLLVDVVMIRPHRSLPPPSGQEASEQGGRWSEDEAMAAERAARVDAVLRALRYRLKAHAHIASEVIVCEAARSLDLKPPYLVGGFRGFALNGPNASLQPLLSASASWLDADELRRYRVTPLVVPGVVEHRAVDLEAIGFGSTLYRHESQWSDLMAWLERERPGRLVFAAEPDEVLDAAQILHLVRQGRHEDSGGEAGTRGSASAGASAGASASDSGTNTGTTGTGDSVSASASASASGSTSGSNPAAAPRLVADAPLASWLGGGCAVPRLRALRYGSERCPLPPRPFENDTLRGWARSAYLFSTGGGWRSWRGRRTVVLMAEPPPKLWINPWTNKERNERHSTAFEHLPPRPSWPLACPLVPSLQSECAARRCAALIPDNRLCPNATRCYEDEVQTHGHERRHLGWRLLDVLTPSSAMARELNWTVGWRSRSFPKSEFNLSMRHLTGRAAEMDGVLIFSRQHSIAVASWYEPLLRARHHALSMAAVQAQARDQAQANVREQPSADLSAEDEAVMARRQVRAVESYIRRHSCATWHLFGLGEASSEWALPEDSAEAMAKVQDADYVDYRTPRFVTADADSRRLPSVEGWPRHTALHLPE